MGPDCQSYRKLPRRDEVLAIIVDRIARSGVIPSYDEIGWAMTPRVGRSRVKQLVDQLIERRIVARDPGSHRGIRLPDLALGREALDRALQDRGWWHAPPLGDLEPPNPCTIEQLPMSPPFEHLPDID
jgi:SOS-response transcriptional repressor LexA